MNYIHRLQRDNSALVRELAALRSGTAWERLQPGDITHCPDDYLQLVEVAG